NSNLVRPTAAISDDHCSQTGDNGLCHTDDVWLSNFVPGQWSGKMVSGHRTENARSSLCLLIKKALQARNPSGDQMGKEEATGQCNNAGEEEFEQRMHFWSRLRLDCAHGQVIAHRAGPGAAVGQPLWQARSKRRWNCDASRAA